MAALMLTPASKLGDIYGRNRMFAIGLAVLWRRLPDHGPQPEPCRCCWSAGSGIEGLGAIIVIPGIAALTAANYEGRIGLSPTR